jgi:hypothetical protein
MVLVAGPLTLAPGESHIAFYATNLFTNTTNLATAEGTDELGETVTDMATATVEVITPAILLEKSCSLSSPTEPSNITYTYVVTNTGDTALLGVTIYDETLDILILGPVDLGPGEYAEGAHTILNASAGIYSNTANATGVDVLGLTVLDEDTETCTVQQVIIIGGEVSRTPLESRRPLIAQGLAALLAALGLLFVVGRNK